MSEAPGSIPSTSSIPSTPSAPSAFYLHEVSTRTDLLDWGVQPNAIQRGSHSSGKLIHKGPNNIPEVGLWVCTPGSWRLSVPRDELCHFVAGRATYLSDTGELIEITPNMVIMFPGGWSGACTVHETIRIIYMLV